MNRRTRRKQRKSGKTKRTTIKVTSNQTPLKVEFTNTEVWAKAVDVFADKQKQQTKSDLYSAIPFWNWLQDQPPLPANTMVTFAGPVFRIVFNGYDPLSTAGSLASGGRYNVGGAQEMNDPKVLTANKFPALYAGDSLDCAKAEAGAAEFLKFAEYYEVSIATPVDLCSIEAILQHYTWPGLDSILSQHPIGMSWVLQKVPTISQLLGLHLFKSGAQGITSPSTKYGEGRVVTFFFRDDQHAKQVLKANRI